MKRIFSIFLMLGICVSINAWGAGSGELRSAQIDNRDTESLGRGALFFLQHCLGCHSLKYIRYEALHKELGISEQEVKQKYIQGKQKLVDPITSAMPAKDATKWFGTETPDLSLTARSRGADWIYNYLHGFYLDYSRPHGVNNTVYPNVAMPHVLHELQGNQVKLENKQGQELHLLEDGRLSPKEYDEAITDLVNFLSYASEPHRLTRWKVGQYVLIFLFFLSLLTLFLKRSYWKYIK